LRINKRIVKHGIKRGPYDYIAESVALFKQQIVRCIINVVNTIRNVFSKLSDAIIKLSKHPKVIKFVETYQNVKNERVDIAYEKLGIDP